MCRSITQRRGVQRFTPLSHEGMGRGGNSPTQTLEDRAKALRSQPYAGDGGTIFRDMGYVAKAAVREYGKDDDARRAFETWCDELQARNRAGQNANAYSMQEYQV